MDLSVPFTLNKQKETTLENNHSVIKYTADEAQLSEDGIKHAEYFTGVNYHFNKIKDFWFMGYQPIIIDNKVVLEMVITHSDGDIERTIFNEIRKFTLYEIKTGILNN